LLHALHADCLEFTAPNAFKPTHPVRVTWAPSRRIAVLDEFSSNDRDAKGLAIQFHLSLNYLG
jgi:hypothetical protein